MTTTTDHVLDNVLSGCEPHGRPFKTDTIATIASIMLSAHDAIVISRRAAKRNRQFAHLDLAAIIAKCAEYYEQNSGGTFNRFAQEVRNEYDRSLSINDEENPLNPNMSDEERAANLAAAIGNFAYTYTPTGRDHNEEHHSVQTALYLAAFAAAWSQHITNTLRKETA